MAKSDKLYSDSPKIERGEDGKHKVEKKAKHHAKPKSDMANTHDRHQRELAEAHKRHEDEIKALHARHQKEAAAVEPMSGTDVDAQAGNGAEEPAATA